MALLAGLVSASPSARGAAQQKEPPDTVGLAPLIVRVLRGSAREGSSLPISVVAGRTLTEATRGAFLDDALAALPGLQVQNRFNFSTGERIAIRNFGARAQFGVRGVRILVDGIPATLPDGQSTLDHLDLAALGRVEVLRGPGAALYGNAAGGVIHFRTRAPPRTPFQAGLRSLTGSHGMTNVQASVAGTRRGWTYRATGSRLRYDGFRINPLSAGRETYGGATRTVFNAVLGAPLGRGRLRAVVNGVGLSAENPGSLSASILAEGDRQAYRFNVLRRTRKHLRQGQTGLTWRGPAGSLDAELAVWGLRRVLDTSIPTRVVDLARWAGGMRALFRGGAETPVGRLSLGGGLEVELQRDDRRNHVNENGTAGALTLDELETVRSTGLFLQGRLEPDNRLALTAGLRYDRFRFQAVDHFFGGGDPDDSGVRSMDAFSPSVGVVASPLRGIELFGNVATSFETPTTTELVNRPGGAGGFNPDLEPERGWTLEGGVRLRRSDVWAVEITSFRTALARELVPFEVAHAPGRTFFRNAGSSLHRGVEVALDGRPASALRVRATYTRIDARFRTYVTENGEYSGHRIPGLAPQRADLTATWRPGPWSVEGRARYRDALPADDANTAEAESAFLLDLRASRDGLSIGGVHAVPFAGISNVLARRYVASVVVNAFGGRYFEPGPGRTFHLGLALTWPADRRGGSERGRGSARAR